MHDPRNLGSVTPDDFRRIREVFESALERRGDERRAFVEEACGGNTLLVAEVERMLAAEDTRHSLLDAPARADAPGGVVECASCSAPIEPGHRFCPACGTPTHDSGTDEGRFRAGALFANRFRIVARLGHGGMGEVYRADDLEVGQPVALKFLTAFRSDERARTRLRSEVRLARQISHPNVCRVYDIGESQGELYLSMEYVDGEDLAALLTRIGRLPIDKGIEIARKLCAGLAAAHAKGVLHRDFKPANIMIDSHGEVRIMDFGLAAIASELEAKDVRSGTPAYMAPEQLAGKEATKQSDLYALGLVLYELFTGKPAFEAKSLEDSLRLRESGPATTPSTLIPELSPRLERAILRCLEPDPQQRPGSALEVSSSLPGGDPLAEALAAGETPSPDMVAAAGDVGAISPRYALVCIGAILAGLLVIVWMSHRSTLTSLVKVEHTAEALAERARLIARDLGYTGGAVSEFTLSADVSYFDHMRRSAKTASAWERLRQPPASLLFQYFESPAGVALHRFGRNEPPRMTPGAMALWLDLSGRLTRLDVVPDIPQTHPRSESSPSITGRDDRSAPSWKRVFEHAGLAIEQFTPTQPTRLPSGFADARAAWDGAFRGQPDARVHIEAAAFEGKPVYFEVVMPWTPPQFATVAPPPFGLMVWYFVAFAGALVLARRNLRLGRSDRRAAFRVSLAVGGSVALITLLVTGSWSTLLPLPSNGGGGMGLADAVWIAFFYWVMYVALEPQVRRVWPEVLIGWTRCLAGRVRDPLVGRDVLVGVVIGVLTAMIPHLYSLVPQQIGLGQHDPVGAPGQQFTFVPFFLLGGRFAASLLPLSIYAGVSVAVLSTLVLLLLTLVLRSRVRGAVAYVVLDALMVPSFGTGDAVDMAFSGVLYAIGIFAIVRFGVLAFTVSVCVWPLLASVSFDTAATYAASCYFVFAAIISLALYGLHTALAGQSLFDLVLFREEPGRSRA
jgi:predicted Ser/Thr protein kinase